MNDAQRAGCAVSSEHLNRRCPATEFPFQTTSEIREPEATLAQQRAVSSSGCVTGHTGHGELRFSRCGASIRVSPESETLVA